MARRSARDHSGSDLHLYEAEPINLHLDVLSARVHQSSQVPATDLQAARLASGYLNDHTDKPATLHHEERQCDGYLLAYTTVFNNDGLEPKAL